MHKTSKFSILLIIIVICSGIATAIGASFASSISNIPLEIKDPLEILEYPKSLSLFPGETTTFNLKILNHASLNYSVRVDVQLNDTVYQNKYVTVSDEVHQIVSNGIQEITSWLKVSADGPEKTVPITIMLTRVSQSTASPTISELPASLELLGGGARWAAKDGNSALFINWKDNWKAHHLTDGKNWGPWPDESKMEDWSYSISYTLKQSGFNIEFAGDIPETLTDYDLVLIHAFWAVEPRHATLIKDYISNGGSVILLWGVPCFFEVFCKDWWPYRVVESQFNYGNNLESIHEWFGARQYANVGGFSYITVNNPFGTSLSVGDTVMYEDGHSAATLTNLNSNVEIVANWKSGNVFAFAYEYGQGRLFFQASFENIDEIAETENRKNELIVNASPIEDVEFLINGEPQITPYKADLFEGNFIIEMPETQNDYIWSHWLEDGNTDRTKIVNIKQNTTLTAIYNPKNDSMTISVVSPQNTTYTTTEIPLQFITNQPFNKASYILDNQQNITIFGNTTLTNINDGPHNVKLFVEDGQGNTAGSETLHFTVDTVSVGFELFSPENKTYNTADVPLFYIKNETCHVTSLELDGQNNLIDLQTTTLMGLIDGVHTLIMHVNYTNSLIGEEVVVTFSVNTTTSDATNPIILIISPINSTYASDEILLNFTTNQTTNWIAYSIDNQENVTIDENVTISGLADWTHELTLIANFTDNNSKFAKICFTIDTTPPKISEVIELPVNVNGTFEDGVKINATVKDAGSGVKQVILNYTTDNQTWTSIEMTNIENETWNGELPAFLNGTNVTYIISAEDEVGNIITTEDQFGEPYQYQILTDVVLWVVLPTSLVVMASTVISRKQIVVPKLTKLNNKIHKILDN